MADMKIKNWHQFQHFKDRKPPWIKLYRDLLDDVEWHELDAEAAKVLVMLWLIASEYDGALPDERALAFRLRMKESQVKSTLCKLSHWLDQDDISAISERYQDDAPETETEREVEKEKEKKQSRSAPLAGFDDFWKVYPRKVAKGSAVKAWRSAIKKAPPDEITSAAGKYKWPDDPKFIPHPATWLNAERWADVEGTPKPSFVSTYRPPPPPPPPAPEMSPEHRAKMAARFNDLLASLGKAKGM
jgi:hypothetical protein